MTSVKAALEAETGKRLWITLEGDEQVTIGHANGGGKSPPDYDLGAILSSSSLEDIADRHAALTYTDGNFRLMMLDGHQVWIGPYELRPGRFFRVVDKDVLKFGPTRLTLRTFADVAKIDEQDR
jgi:hypothetical protein